MCLTQRAQWILFLLLFILYEITDYAQLALSNVEYWRGNMQQLRLLTFGLFMAPTLPASYLHILHGAVFGAQKQGPQYVDLRALCQIKTCV